MNRWQVGQSLGKGRFHPDRLASPGCGIRRQHRHGIRVVQARYDGMGRKTGKQRHRNRAQPGNTQKRGLDFGDHRHIDAHRLTGPYTARGKGRGDAGGFGGKVGIGPAAAASVFADPVDSDLVAQAIGNSGVKTGFRQIQPTFHGPPDRIGPFGDISQPAVGPREPYPAMVDDPTPEPVWVFIRTVDELLVTVNATVFQK